MTLPTIELFAIGTELILGRVQDTNSYWIAQRITELGGNLRRVTMITDDEADIIAAVNGALRRTTDVIMTMGGLGPTADDRTVATIGKLLGRGTFTHEPTVEHYMTRREFTDRSQISPGLLKMATVPEGAEVFNNPEGWAPCIRLTIQRTEWEKGRMGEAESTPTLPLPHSPTHLFILPGPPRELASLFDLCVAPFLRTLFTGFSVTCRVFVDAFESQVAPLFHELMEKYPRTYMKAMIAKKQEHPERGLPIDLVAMAEDQAAAQATMQAMLDEFIQRLWTMGKTLIADAG